MNSYLQLSDFITLGPLLVVLMGALIVLLIESFFSRVSKPLTFWVSVLTLLVAISANFFIEEVDSMLLSPWLRSDSLSQLFTFLFLTIGLITVFLAHAFFEKMTNVTTGEYYFLLLSCIFGLILIGDAADFLTLFLGIETLSISLYVLCGYVKHWRLSHESALKYFLMGAMGSAFLLYGIALIYGSIGSTSFDDLTNAYQALAGPEKTLFLAGVALVTLGLSFKAAIVPFHVWAPDVYDGAPTPVTAFMAVGTKLGAFAAFIVLFLGPLEQFDKAWSQVMATLAIFTLIYANLVALRQTQLRRFFAYSGISHAGYMLIPLIAGGEGATHALLFYLVVYALATLGSFAVLALLDRSSEGVRLSDLHGLFKRAPWAACLFALCLLTLAGIPPTIGFFAKFYVFQVAFFAGYYGLVIVALFTTILAAFYYLRIISLMFAEKAEEEGVLLHSWSIIAVGAVLMSALLIFSVYPEPLLAFLSKSL